MSVLPANNDDETKNTGIIEGSDFSLLECAKYILFLIIFTIMTILNVGSNNAYYIGNKIGHSLTDNLFTSTDSDSPKSLHDITSFNDIYLYIDDILIPFLLPIDSNDDNNNSCPLSYKTRNIGIVLRDNYLLGGFRLRQMITNRMDCFNNLNQFKCYYEISNTDKYLDKSKFNDIKYKSGYELNEKVKFETKLGFYDGGGHVVDFPVNRDESKRQIQQLKDDNFFGPWTRAVIIDFNTYNPNLNLHSLSRIFIQTPSSGGFVIRKDIKTLRFNRYTNKSRKALLAIEIAFGLFVIYFTFEEIIEITCNGIREYIKDSWNILDWINLILFYFSGMLKYMIFYEMMDNIELYNLHTYVSFRDLYSLFKTSNYITMLNGFLMYMKLFKYMTFSKRIRFLFSMLYKSALDLSIFSIVLAVFIVSFAISAFLMFGSDIDDFRTFTSAIINLVRYTISDMNYDELSKSNRYVGNIFYVSWSILMILVLVNVFIAILSEAYSQISNEHSDETQVTQKFKQIFQKYQNAFQNFKLKFKSKFSNIDTNNDGKIDKIEIIKIVNIKEDEAQQIISKFDEDGDGLLDDKEFSKINPQSIKQVLLNEKLKDIIKQLKILKNKDIIKENH